MTRAALVGQPVRRREDDRILRGLSRFVDDIERPGLAHVAFTRSVHACARIRGIRTPPADTPGLIAVLTAADLTGRARPLPARPLPGMTLTGDPHPLLAAGDVAYVGQPIAAVVAESRAWAEDAAELVEVDYEPADAVVDVMASHAPIAHWRGGDDVSAVFAGATHVVRAVHEIPRLAAVPMEPRGAVAEHDPGLDLLTVHCSAQDSARPLAQLAHALDRPDDTIRVIVPDVGGAFGSKGTVAPEIVVVAAAAMQLGRPLKWTEDRLENFLAGYQGRGVHGEVELALDDDGRFLAVRARIVADLGAYLLPNTVVPAHTTAMLMCGCYDIPAADVEVLGMRTHKVPVGPYRGAGRPEAAFLLERTVDAAARTLGVDPVELRRRNLVRAFPHRTPLGWTYDSGDYERCLDQAVELVDPERAAGGGSSWAPAWRCTSSARAVSSRARAIDRGAERPRRHRQRQLPARPGARDHIRPDRRRRAWGGAGRRRPALRRQRGRPSRRRDVREPLDGDGRLGDRASLRADPRALRDDRRAAARCPRGERQVRRWRLPGPGRARARRSGTSLRPPTSRSDWDEMRRSAWRRRRGSRPTWCSRRAPTQPSSRSSGPPVG